MTLPYRVIDLTSGGASICGQMLGDLGADVVLVEPPGGVDPRHTGPFHRDQPNNLNASIAFWALNRNKRSVVLDLEAPESRETFRRLVRDADVLVESKPPGWLAARGLGHEELSADNPGLVIVSLTPFGPAGPKANWAATDLTLTAASGAMIMTGDEDRAPLSLSEPQAWLNAGIDAAFGALVALQERAHSGRGQRVDVSPQTSMMQTAQSYILAPAWKGAFSERLGGGFRVGSLRLRFHYPCSDGFVNFTFLFGPMIGPFTARMFEWMYEEGFVDAATRDKDWIGYGALLASGEEPLSEVERCMGLIETFTLAHTKAELYNAAFEKRVLIVPLSDASDLANSRQLDAREFWVPVEHEELGQSVRYPGPFVKLSATPIQSRRRPPLLGEHQEEVLAEKSTPRPHTTSERPPGSNADALPLAGVRVLDFTWAYAGPAITRMLADFGATIVRVESAKRLDALRSTGPFKNDDPAVENSGNYANANAGKLGLGLDLSHESGRDVARRLVGWADVVVENFSPRVMPAWNLDYAHLKEIKPDLIMLSSSLYGQTGPEHMLAGFGTMGASIAGFGFLAGWADRPPTGPFGAYTDYISPRFAACAIVAALDHRRRTGEGQYIDCSQVESTAGMISTALLDYTVNGQVTRPNGNANPFYSPSGVYPVRGKDRWIALSAPNVATWSALATLAERGWASDARFATPADRLAHADELDAALAQWTRDWSVDDLETALQEVGVPAHRVATPQDIVTDPQIAARGHLVEVPHPRLGPVTLEATRAQLSRTPAQYTTSGPMIGEHNQEVLRDLLELDDDQITELIIAGVIE